MHLGHTHSAQLHLAVVRRLPSVAAPPLVVTEYLLYPLLTGDNNMTLEPTTPDPFAGPGMRAASEAHAIAPFQGVPTMDGNQADIAPAAIRELFRKKALRVRLLFDMDYSFSLAR